MKQTLICVLSVVTFTILPMKHMQHRKPYRKPPVKNLYEHEHPKYYHPERALLFGAIKSNYANFCEYFIKTHKDLAETKDAFGNEKITIDHYPITYLLSLENNKKQEETYRLQKENIIDVILENTGAEVLCATFSYILSHITSGFFTVNDITLITLEKILARKNSIVSTLLQSNEQKAALDVNIQFLDEIDTALRLYKYYETTITTEDQQCCYNMLYKHYQEQQK